jgi:hypothetical protein
MRFDDFQLASCRNFETGADTEIDIHDASPLGVLCESGIQIHYKTWGGKRYSMNFDEGSRPLLVGAGMIFPNIVTGAYVFDPDESKDMPRFIEGRTGTLLEAAAKTYLKDLGYICYFEAVYGDSFAVIGRGSWMTAISVSVRHATSAAPPEERG